MSRIRCGVSEPIILQIVNLSRQKDPQLTRREIAEKTGVSLKTVYNYQKKYGVL